MKIAIASEGKKLDSKVCPTAGRAPYYLIFEDKTLVKTIKNPFAIGSGGAGSSVAQMLANEGVNQVVAGTFGGNMTAILDLKNIEYKEINNKTIQEIIDNN